MTETQEQQQLIDWLKYQYPDVMFRVDYSAGMRVSISQAKKMKRMQSRRGWPDLFIAAARNGWSGLFIEFKKTGNNPFRKDGKLKADPHLKEQLSTLVELREEGYQAVFGVGFDASKKIIEKYLKKK